MPVGQKKGLSIPPIWGCCGPTRGSFFTHRQIKNPASSVIAVKTHSGFGQYLADHFACVPPALKKGWIFYLPIGKKWTSSRSTTISDRWYRKFFFWSTGTSNDVCIRYINGSIYLWICVWILPPGQRWLPFQKLKIKGEGLKIISFGDIEYKLGTYVSRIFVTKILIILICPWYMDYFKRTSNEITQCKILGPIIFFGRSLSIQTVLLFGRYLKNLKKLLH